jgi:DNA polymerase I
MLRYVRARWYSREAAESVTAWGRQYIQGVGKKAEDAGFNVLYQDTDSIFLLMGDKKEEDVVNFMNKINSELPESMELELEDFYKRGVFVAKKTKEEKGAKKKYALINKEGKIKIRGFELVRRDWSKVARDTQRAVLRTILEEGSKEKAIQIVRDVIENLKTGNVDLNELVIYTQLKKKNYVVTSPELAAAEKARKRKMKIKIGSIIGYIITKQGNSISERSELIEYAKDYDPDYYINNQVLPAVLRILGELGYTEDDIKYLGKQSSLDSWF